MRKALGRIRGRCAEARGFTLIELLIAAAMSLLVLGTGVALMSTGMRNEPKVAEKAGEIQKARVAMERLTREIRQGDTVVSATPTQLSLITYVNSATCGGATSSRSMLCRVTYSCAAGACTRTESNPDGSGSTPPVTVVSGITSTSVFSYSPSATAPTHVGVHLLFPSESGDDSITLTDGVTMRNASTPAT